MMEAVADKNLHPYTIEKAASTIATLAGEGKSFSNSKIDIDIGDKGATIKMDGKTVYANQSITAEATPENKNTLGKLNDKAKELTIQASYDVQQGMNKTPALASERSV
jgi:aerobic-type carbon monoxide dehydrogenase small subunit (CoxS/CutS family)